MKKALTLGSSLACTAVILGALNAHALKQYFDPSLTESFGTGVRYQMYHALAILILATLSKSLDSKIIHRCVALFGLGTLLFSGSIYLLCALKSNGIIGLKGLGIVTPIGGVVLIISWCYLLFSTLNLNLKENK